MKPIWIVDDDKSIRWVLEKALAKAQMSCRLFAQAGDVLKAMEDESPSVLLSDIRISDMSGLDLLARVKKRFPQLPVVIMTAYSDLDSAVSAFQGGAYEYLAKPFDINRVIELLRRACEESEKAAQGVKAFPEQESRHHPDIIGQSRAMQEVFRAIGRLSQSHATVLLTGESGAGKEVVARALHRHSLRRAAPFVAINTAAIPRELLESELFGHERGAFTGANATQIGRFEQAKGGTLFLDEIGDMPMELQTRLLRVLSDGSFYRVGGSAFSKGRTVQVYLEQRVAQGLFREDLFHRLNVIRLRLPALRERPEDIESLADYFLAKAASSLKTERKYLSAEALEFMRQYPFPGNVRQLENICNWLTVMASSRTIRVADLPPEMKTGGAGTELAQSAQCAGWTEELKREVAELLEQEKPGLMNRLTDKFEAAVFQTALAFTHGKKVEAAQRLGVGRNTLTRKLQELGLQGDEE